MLGTHLKIAWRNLIKNKGYFGINILGLSVALTVSFLMLLWVYDEYSMDKFHENDSRLYYVKRTIPLPDGVFDVYDGISYPLLKTATEELPEIEKYVTLGAGFEDNLRVGNTDYRAQGAYTNASFFSAFSFPVLAGWICIQNRRFALGIHFGRLPGGNSIHGNYQFSGDQGRNGQPC
jgi:putative ABC transport system permease protein